MPSYFLHQVVRSLKNFHCVVDVFDDSSGLNKLQNSDDLVLTESDFTHGDLLDGLGISLKTNGSFAETLTIRLHHYQTRPLEIHNELQHFYFFKINVMQDSSRRPAQQINVDLRKIVRERFMPRDDTLLSMTNITAVNEKNNPQWIMIILINKL